jgi:hypothetical protein
VLFDLARDFYLDRLFQHGELCSRVLDACPEDLAIYLRERDPENLDEAAKVVEQFLIFHG